MQQRHQVSLRPQSIIAVRDDVGPGWKMLKLNCELHDLSRHLDEIGLGDIEHRVVGTGQVIPEYEETFVVDRALKSGWHQDRETGAWFPIEEPLSRLPGTPVHADVSLGLKSIMYGWITIAVEAGGKALNLQISDIDDSFLLLVRFVQILAAGGEPHAALAERSTGHFVVQNGAHPRQCSFYVKIRREGEIEIIDVLTDRAMLLRQLRNLAAAIADHPWFIHHYFCHCCLPSDEYDRVGGAADLEWENGVKAERHPDDIDARDEFVAAKIVAEVPSLEECALAAEQERAMLRSLEIPQEWLLSHGLVSQKTDTRLSFTD